MPKKTERGAGATSQINNTKVKEPTQEECALAYMKRHGSLTTLTAVTELYIMNPQQVISKLRRSGYNIDTVYEKTPKGKRYGRYILKEEESA